MADPMGESKEGCLRVDFDRRQSWNSMAATSLPMPVCSRIGNWMMRLDGLLGTSRLSGHVASTSGLPLKADIRASTKEKSPARAGRRCQI